jgi:hypothetical protein
MVTYTIAADDDFHYGCTVYTSSANGVDTVQTSNKLILDCRDDATIFWSYPKDNLQITFQADETASQPFTVCLHELEKIYNDISVVHLNNGQESPVDQFSSCFDSDENNLVAVKLYGTKEMKYYGVFVKFSIQV